MTRVRYALSLAFIAVLHAGCGRGAADASRAPLVVETKPPLGQGTPSQNLTNAYLVLHAYLAHDDFKDARAAFDRVQTAVQVGALEIAPALRKRIADAATQGSSSADLPHQRVAFGALSDGLIAWFRTADNPLADGLSVAHCPMAFDGKGAKWIQRGDKIENPYYGGEMLTCGSVDATLVPGKKL